MDELYVVVLEISAESDGYYVREKINEKVIMDHRCIDMMDLSLEYLLKRRIRNIFEDVIFVIESKRENRSDIEAFKAI